MDWDDIRQRWREDVPDAPLTPIGALQQSDRKLAKAVRRRDLFETAAAWLVAAIFAVWCVVAAVQGRWLLLFFGLVVTLWAVWVPFVLRRARREVPAVDHRLPPRLYLSRQRDAALLQARLLERAWLWYLTPPAVGIIGLTLTLDGFTTGSMAYLAGLLAVYAGLAWLNRHVARTRFRAHAEALQSHIRRLEDDME